MVVKFLSLVFYTAILCAPLYGMNATKDGSILLNEQEKAHLSSPIDSEDSFDLKLFISVYCGNQQSPTPCLVTTLEEDPYSAHKAHIQFSDGKNEYTVAIPDRYFNENKNILQIAVQEGIVTFIKK
jgi:hypothetical protein